MHPLSMMSLSMQLSIFNPIDLYTPVSRSFSTPYTEESGQDHFHEKVKKTGLLGWAKSRLGKSQDTECITIIV